MTDLKTLMNLEGRRALITGAAGNLGRVLADSLAELGADLILVDLPDADTVRLAAELKQHHGINATAEACDLEDAAEREALASRVQADGSLSILVNNAAFVGTSGLAGWAVPFEQQSVETWRRALEVNLTSAFHLCQLLAPTLADGRGGNIVNVASIYGQWGPDWSLYEGTQMTNPAAYSVSKGGLIQFTRWLATTLAPSVRVNAFSPGGIRRGQHDQFINRYVNRTPMGRMASEEDFKGVIAFLASDMSAYLTGQVINIDGGWGVW